MDNKDLGKVLDVIPRFKHELFKLKDFNTLNRTQVRTLMLIKKMQGKKTTDICRLIGLEKSSFTRVVDKLIEIGLVKRIRPENDRRTVLIYLTDKGEDYTEVLIKRMNEYLRSRFAALTKEEEKEFLKAIEILDKTAKKVFAQWKEN